MLEDEIERMYQLDYEDSKEDEPDFLERLKRALAQIKEWLLSLGRKQNV